LNVVLFESLGTVSYSPSSNYGRICSHLRDPASKNGLTLKCGFGVLEGH